MGDVVAIPIEQASSLVVPQGMAINNLFDWQVMLGVPFWVFVSCALLFCVAAIWVYWIARIRKLSAVKGWKESLDKKDPTDVQVWLITRVQSLIIGCMKIEDNVLSYHDKAKIGMWHHNTRESVIRVGGNPAVVVSEDFDQTRDFISEIALTDCADEFNEGIEGLLEEYKKAAEESGRPDKESSVVKPITTYEDYDEYGREALQLAYPDGLVMKSHNIFNNARFLKYFPRGCSHMFFGGILLRDANKLKKHTKDAGLLAKYGFMAAALVVVMIGILAAWLVPLGR